MERQAINQRACLYGILGLDPEAKPSILSPASRHHRISAFTKVEVFPLSNAFDLIHANHWASHDIDMTSQSYTTVTANSADDHNNATREESNPEFEWFEVVAPTELPEVRSDAFVR